MEELFKLSSCAEGIILMVEPMPVHGTNLTPQNQRKVGFSLTSVLLSQSSFLYIENNFSNYCNSGCHEGLILQMDYCINSHGSCYGYIVDSVSFEEVKWLVQPKSSPYLYHDALPAPVVMGTH